MATKVPVVVELFYTGTWHSLTAADEVLTRDVITISRDTRPRAARSVTAISLRSVNGKYASRNADSPLYGLLGRNTPLRVYLDMGTDTFALRTVVDGWGNASDGKVYNLHGATASDYDVASSHGTIQPSALGSRRFATVDIGAVDFDIETDMQSGAAPASGTYSQGVVGRFTDTDNHYVARVQVSTTSTLTLLLSRRVAGVTTTLDSVVVTLAHSSGAPRRLRFRGHGGYLFVKVWDSAVREPSSWDLAVNDDAPLTSGTRVGAYAINDTAVTTHVLQFNDLAYRDFRSWGEVESWPHRWNLKGNDVWVPLTVWGVLHRLAAPGVKAPVRSALFMVIAAAAIAVPIAWWPFEDGALTDAAQSGLPTGQPSRLSGVSPGTGDAGPMFSGCVDFRPGGFISGKVPDAGTFVAATGWTVEWVARFEKGSQNVDATPSMVAWTTDSPDVNLFETVIYPLDNIDFPAGGLIVGWPGGDSGLLSTVQPYSDNLARHYRVTAKQSGGNIDIRTFVNGVQVDQTNQAGTLGRILAFQVGDGDQGQEDPWQMAGFCELVFYNSATHGEPTVAAAAGFVGETATTRIARLAQENGLGCVILGAPGEKQSGTYASTAMGIQRLAPLPDLFYDAAEVDGGVFYEPREFLGVTYRTLRSMYNTAPVLTLNYAAGSEVAPQLEPADVDIANDITVRRYLGSAKQRVRETGPNNVAEPADDPQGVGRIPKEWELVLNFDDQAGEAADWLLHLNTWDEEGFSNIPIDTGALLLASKTTLHQQASALDMADRLRVDDIPTWVNRDTVKQYVTALVEDIGTHRRLIRATTLPASPYDVAVYGSSAAVSRYDTMSSTLTADFDAGTDTSMSVATLLGPLWTTDGADLPLQVQAAGVILNVTAISGAASPQTFTVDAATVNGVVKTIPADTPVSLAYPTIYAR